MLGHRKAQHLRASMFALQRRLRMQQARLRAALEASEADSKRLVAMLEFIDANDTPQIHTVNGEGE